MPPKVVNRGPQPAILPQRRRRQRRLAACGSQHARRRSAGVRSRGHEAGKLRSACAGRAWKGEGVGREADGGAVLHDGVGCNPQVEVGAVGGVDTDLCEVHAALTHI